MNQVDTLATRWAAQRSDWWTTQPPTKLRRWRIALEVELFVVSLAIGLLFYKVTGDATVWVVFAAVWVFMAVFFWLLFDKPVAAFKWVILAVPAFPILAFGLAYLTRQ